jgi:hypothetical protein
MKNDYTHSMDIKFSQSDSKMWNKSRLQNTQYKSIVSISQEYTNVKPQSSYTADKMMMMIHFNIRNLSTGRKKRGGEGGAHI